MSSKIFRLGILVAATALVASCDTSKKKEPKPCVKTKEKEPNPCVKTKKGDTPFEIPPGDPICQKDHFILIPKGTFTMGYDHEQFARPAHRVTISQDYCFMNHRVTRKEYKKFVEATGRQMPKLPPPDMKNENSPIVNVFWSDARAYCKWIGADLPTEAQWERAVRGKKYQDLRYDKYAGSSNYHCHVGEKDLDPVEACWTGGKRIVWGKTLCDTRSGVHEWVLDWYGNFSANPVTDPKGPKEDKFNESDRKHKVARSGSNHLGPEHEHVLIRQPFPTNLKFAGTDLLGIRCASTVPDSR